MRCGTCRQFIRRVPGVPSGEGDIQDVHTWAEEVGDDPRRRREETGFAAAPGVGFPAERLVAARGIGIMVDYF